MWQVFLTAIIWFAYWLLEDFLVHFAPSNKLKIVIKTVSTVIFLSIVFFWGYWITDQTSRLVDGNLNLPDYKLSILLCVVALVYCIYGRVLPLLSEHVIGAEILRAPKVLIAMAAPPLILVSVLLLYESFMVRIFQLAHFDIFSKFIGDFMSAYFIMLILLLPYLFSISKEIRKRRLDENV